MCSPLIRSQAMAIHDLRNIVCNSYNLTKPSVIPILSLPLITSHGRTCQQGWDSFYIMAQAWLALAYSPWSGCLRYIAVGCVWVALGVGVSAY